MFTQQQQSKCILLLLEERRGEKISSMIQHKRGFIFRFGQFFWGEKKGREMNGEGDKNNIYKHLHLIRVPFFHAMVMDLHFFVVVVVVVMYPRRILPKEDLKGFRFLFLLSRLLCCFCLHMCSVFWVGHRLIEKRKN